MGTKPKPDTRQKKHVLTATEIQQKWEAEEKGLPWPPPAELSVLRNEKEELRKKVMMLENKVASSSVSALRAKLDEMLAKFGIQAAFEPLIEIALERYPDTHPTLGGQLVCSVDQRIKIWTELLSYQLPKLKAVEMAGQVDHSLTVIIKRFGGGEDQRLVQQMHVPEPIDITTAPITEEPNKHVSIKRF